MAKNKRHPRDLGFGVNRDGSGRTELSGLFDKMFGDGRVAGPDKRQQRELEPICDDCGLRGSECGCKPAGNFTSGRRG